jgi:hypothetical protein
MVLVLAEVAPIPRLFARMLAVLDAIHDANPSWGPLYVVHPGDLARDLVFAPRAASAAHVVPLQPFLHSDAIATADRPHARH